ncbi:MAG: hypothetical protein ACFB01_17000 [Cohaesibacteraceae bacterium]
MSGPSSRTPKKGVIEPLRDDQIVTKRSVGRRAFLGIMTAGSVGAVLTPTSAVASDTDNGTWTDSGSCPRGYGTGFTDSDVGNGADPVGWGYSGVTDRDNGNISDAGGHGRGAPYC